MKFLLIVLSTCLLCACNPQSNEVDEAGFAIIIHGGAGYITADRIDSTSAQAYRDTLKLAMDTGYEILSRGGSAVDAVEACLNILEDCSMFNAGRGSVYNSKAQQEMDASIMDGHSLNSGAVAGVRRIKNPISAARLVMDSSKHVMLAGAGAEILAQHYGLSMEDSAYFYDPKGYKRIQEQIKRDKHGTVGAVALDRNGHIAAATSTGGMFNKKWNRIGDSPIIGAGTYANDNNVGISCTGTGEYFIRTVAAHSVAAYWTYEGQQLDSAMATVLRDIKNLGGEGGMIGLDKYGNLAWSFNTPGMFRAYRHSVKGENLQLFRME